MRFVLAVLLSTVASSAVAAWTQEVLAPYGLKSSLAVDDTGVPHVAYTTCYWHGLCFDDDPTPARLWYAVKSGPGRTWTVLQVDGEGGYGIPSLVLDPIGDAHVAYQYVAWHGFRYAVGNLAGFEIDTLDHLRPSYAKKNPSLVLDAFGQPHIGFYEAEGIVYTTRRLGIWHEEEVPPGSLEEWRSLTPIALDAQQRPVIVAKGYFTGEWAFRKTDQGWTPEQIDDTRQGHDTALIADENGVLHAAYVAEGETSLDVVRYATDASGSWLTEDVGPGELPGAVALDAAGRPHIVFLRTTVLDPFEGEVTLAVRSDSGWLLETIAPVGQFPSLDLDTTGRPHVTFHRPTDGALVYAVRDEAVAAERLSWGELRARYRK